MLPFSTYQNTLNSNLINTFSGVRSFYSDYASDSDGPLEIPDHQANFSQERTQNNPELINYKHQAQFISAPTLSA